jgi:tetratricopeptide (TPR) repeat protein
MKHLSEHKLGQFIEGSLPRNEADQVLEHIDHCFRCRDGWVTLLLPSTRSEAPLTKDEKDEIFENVMREAPSKSAQVLSFPKAAGRIAAAFAVAAGLALVVFTGVRDRIEPQTPVVSGPEAVAENPDQVSVHTGDSDISINGKRVRGKRELDGKTFALVTEKGEKAEVSVGKYADFTVEEDSRFTFSIVGDNEIQGSLVGSLAGSLDHDAGKSLSIEVPGGLYRVIGTVFRISTEKEFSSITVKEGRVAYYPFGGGEAADTISAGQSKKFIIAEDPETIVQKTRIEQTDRVAVSRPASEADTESASDEYASRFFSSDTPDEPNVRLSALQKARTLIQNGKPEEALSILRTYIGTVHGHDAKLSMGLAFEKLGDVDSALQCYRACSGVFVPNNHRVPALRRIGRLCHLAGMWEKSAAAYEKYLSIAQDGADRSEALSRLVNYYTHKESNTERRIQLLEMWVTAEPTRELPLYLLATALREKDPKRASSHFEEYILKYPQGEHREDAMYWSAWCSKVRAERSGDYSEYERKANRYTDAYPQGQYIELVEKR